MRILRASLCLSLGPAGVVAFDPDGLVPSGTLKTTTVQVMLLVLAGTVAVASLGDDTSVGSSLPANKRLLGTAALGFSGWMVLSTSMAVDRWHAVVGTPDRRFGLLAWLLIVLAVWIGIVLAKAHRALVHSLHLGSVLAALMVTLFRVPNSLAGCRAVVMDSVDAGLACTVSPSIWGWLPFSSGSHLLDLPSIIHRGFGGEFWHCSDPWGVRYRWSGRLLVDQCLGLLLARPSCPVVCWLEAAVSEDGGSGVLSWYWLLRE